jgi:hypothetical protein
MKRMFCVLLILSALIISGMILRKSHSELLVIAIVPTSSSNVPPVKINVTVAVPAPVAIADEQIQSAQASSPDNQPAVPIKIPEVQTPSPPARPIETNTVLFHIKTDDKAEPRRVTVIVGG